jgi:hypothetical protein
MKPLNLYFNFTFFFFFRIRFIITTIKNALDYNPRSFYWLGAEFSKNDEFEWTDGSRMSFTGWLSGPDKLSKAQTDLMCLALLWKVSPTPMIASNLYWVNQKCSSMGGYVCKKSRKNNVLIQNQTITGVEGRLTSPDYPNPYASNIDYWIKIIAPERSRIVVQFQKLDIEQQEECLYDYVSVQDSDFRFVFNPNQIEGFATKGEIASMDYQNDDENVDFRRFHQLDKRRIARSAVEITNKTSFHPYIRWCGQHEGDMSQFDFVSRTNEVSLNFFSDHSSSGEGFSATWRSIDISACPGQTLTSHEGVITSPNFPHFLLHNLNCSYIIQAPIGRKVWLEFNGYDIIRDANVHVDLGNGVYLQPFHDGSVIGDGVYLSQSERVKITLKTGANPRGKGFKATFRTSNLIGGRWFRGCAEITSQSLVNYEDRKSVKIKN